MLGKFSKAELATVNVARESVRTAVDALKDLLDGEKPFASQAALDEHLNDLRVRYDRAVETCLVFTSFLTTFVEDQQSQFEDKSERGQEGERA
mgnify:CR=1 FL=1